VAVSVLPSATARPRQLKRFGFFHSLMENICNEDDFKVLLSREHAIVYFYVDWSAYAMEGLRMLEQLESSWSDLRCQVTFGLADVSDVNASAAFMLEWLKRRERSDQRLCNRIAAGNGSVMWLTHGEIADFEPSVTRHDVSVLTARTKNAFQLGET
jgi:hypothetical protein